MRKYFFFDSIYIFGFSNSFHFSKVEGKGNGIKTVIVNMSEIAKSLSRPPTCMFFLSHFEFNAPIGSLFTYSVMNFDEQDGLEIVNINNCVF